MKKTTLLNSMLSSVISRMGHMDTLTIGDAGLPIPDGPERIDLAVVKGIPTFLDVLNAALSEMEVQKVTIASEMKEKNAELYEIMKQTFADVEIVEVPHAEFKKLTAASKAVVRTGAGVAAFHVRFNHHRYSYYIKGPVVPPGLMGGADSYSV